MSFDIIDKIYLFLSGVQIAIGLVFLSTASIRNVRKGLLSFGIMSIGSGMYLLLFHVDELTGIWNSQMYVAGFFMTVYSVVLPWFIGRYSGYVNKPLILLFNALFIWAFLDYLLGNRNNDNHWVYIAIPCYIGMYAYGVVTGYFRSRKTSGRSAIWFIIPSVFLMLFSLAAFMRGVFRNVFDIPHLFDAYDAHPTIFILFMTFEIRNEFIKTNRLRRIIESRDLRLKEIMDKAHLLIAETDTAGTIRNLNPFFTKITGHGTECYGKSLSGFLEDLEDSDLIRFFSAGKQEYLQCSVKTTKGEKGSVLWSCIPMNDDLGNTEGYMFIGTDVNELEKAMDEINELKLHLEKENVDLKESLAYSGTFPEIIGKSKAIQYVIERINQVAESDAAVLILGETGVGKELVARAIHKTSSRKLKPFFVINCATIPKELMESELFGHEKGSFTGAHKQKKGRIELANGGTVFLDEVGELPLELQPKLLRFLQEGEFERIGGQTTVKTDIRIISATNKDLEKEVAGGKFRQDLYYRLNVFPITLPPLRSRKEDIPDLTRYYVKSLAGKSGKTIDQISKAVMEQLKEYDWPGNVRELINILERAIIYTNGSTLSRLDALPPKQDSHLVSEILSMEAIEKEHLQKVLEKTNWKISGKNGAAELLEMNPNTLRSRMEKLGIKR